MKHRIFVSLAIGLFLSMSSAGLFERLSASQTGASENVRAWYSSRYVQLNWDPTDPGQTAGYNIYRAMPEDWQWVKLNRSPHPLSSFVDFSPPESSVAYYRIVPVGGDNDKMGTGAEAEVRLSAEVRVRVEQQDSLSAILFDKNYILSDAEFTDSSAMTLDEIQAFLASRGSVLARYESNGMTAAQHIYDAAQTHGINPRGILVMLQVHHGLITSSQLDLAKINRAMNWNLSDPSAQNFADQVFYATQQLRDYYDNLSAHGLTINQPIEVNDGIITPANAATAALYGYIPWIGEGGGGQKGIGGVYLFWDLWDEQFIDLHATQTNLPRLRFPIQNLRPYNTRITSIIDHNRTTTGIMVAYTGERGNVNGCTDVRTGYQNSSGVGFYLTGDSQYSPPAANCPQAANRYLWYEQGSYQHPGYDYGVTGTIVAPAAGTLYLVNNDPANRFVNETRSAYCRFHTFKIVHDNGLETWFLHSERFVDEITHLTQ
jgi:hypothetical protein